MNVLKDNQFFTNVSATSTSSACIVPNNVSTLVLEITESSTPTFTLSVEGVINSSNTAYTTLSAVKMSTTDVISSITSTGIYIVPIDGMSNIKLNLTAISGGSISAYGKLGD